MSKKKKKGKNKHAGCGIAFCIAGLIGLAVAVSLAHLSVLERLEAMETQLSEVNAVQGHIRAYLGGGSTQ